VQTSGQGLGGLVQGVGSGPSLGIHTLGIRV
jgi:hypothetical protein